MAEHSGVIEAVSRADGYEATAGTRDCLVHYN